MKRKLISILFMLLAVLTITACGEKKESEETIVKEEIL